MISDFVDSSNFILYAAKHYANPECFDDEEFFSDLKRLKYVKRLLKKFEESGDLKERLILNHIIILHNMFGIDVATRLLFFKLPGQHSLLKPFLEMLGYLPEIVTGIGNPAKSINTIDIQSNPEIEKRLREI